MRTSEINMREVRKKENLLKIRNNVEFIKKIKKYEKIKSGILLLYKKRAFDKSHLDINSTIQKINKGKNKNNRNCRQNNITPLLVLNEEIVVLKYFLIFLFMKYDYVKIILKNKMLQLKIKSIF